MKKTAAIYVRASTDATKQANSMDVQHAVIAAFANANGYNIVKVFEEYESGRDDERAQFNAAINYTRQEGCYLLVNKCDRFARSMGVFAKCQDILPMMRFAELGNVEPSLLTLSILFAVAANESLMTGARVKATMSLLKEKGQTFGNPNILTDAHPLAIKAIKHNAKSFNDGIKSILDDLRKAGYKSTKSLVDRLNSMGIKTRTNGAWTYHNLYRVINQPS
tara:strand:- start:1424 stop:2086 length:663 start_codon:yes stop_codon:yes gene_type:complete